jgi:hypothetical protein
MPGPKYRYTDSHTQHTQTLKIPLKMLQILRLPCSRKAHLASELNPRPKRFPWGTGQWVPGVNSLDSTYQVTHT